MKYMGGSSMSDNILEVKNLYVKNDSFELKNINFNLPKGSIMALLGRNGAGKTTLIKSIINQIVPTSGKVLFWDKELLHNEEEIFNNLGLAIDEMIIDNYKPKKIIGIKKIFYKNFDYNKYKELMKKFNLDERKTLAKYSKGMKMKFNIINAVCCDADLIILDEPTAGLDPVSRAEVMNLLQEIMQNEEKSILISTHILSDIEDIADYITFMKNGEVYLSKAKDDLIDSFRIIKIEENNLTEELKKEIKGLKKNIFGYEGLINNKSLFENIEGIKLKVPTLEEIMVFSERGESI